MHIADGWISEDRGDTASVFKNPTPAICALTVDRPLGIVWHTVGGRGRTRRYAHNVADQIARPHHRGASWHVLISRWRELIVSAPVTVGTNHVGRMAEIAGRRVGVNGSTIGIEIENCGPLMETGWGWSAVANPHRPRGEWQPLTATPIDVPKRELRNVRPLYIVPDSEVVEVLPGEHWHAFTSEQVQIARELVACLARDLGIPRETAGLLHSQFDPDRKVDPGPVWERHLTAILADVYGPPAAPELAC